MANGLRRVGITGASGCGVTTLGAALSVRLDAVHIDTDDHFWVATDPPYQIKRDIPERLARLAAEQARTGRWVVSGTMDGWAAPALRDVELIVFLQVPTEVRLERLRRREQARFGDALLPGGAMHGTHREFIDWAAKYDLGTEPGRSGPRQEKWLAGLRCRVLRLDGTRPTADLVEAILSDAMSGGDGLERFVEAQASVYADALSELREGRKRSHWMWFVFPQLRGLGSSAMSVRYGIESLEEAAAYLAHPILGPRLAECTEAVNAARALSAVQIFGSVDAAKLRSSMTLFEMAGGGSRFRRCLDSFFQGVRDPRTMELLEARS